jgi:HEPN domain-containing protein
MTNGAAQEWLALAEADLHFARLGQKDVGALENLIAFHAQQATEKALKAVLLQHEVEFPKTHDLEELFELLQTAGLVWATELNKVLARPGLSRWDGAGLAQFGFRGSVRCND